MNVSILPHDSLNNSTDSSHSDRSRIRDNRRALNLRGATESVYSFFSDINAEVYNNSIESVPPPTPNTFSMLASSTEELSNTSRFDPISGSGSESSGVTIYADATSSTDGEGQTHDLSLESSLDFLREHVTWQRESVGGLVTVKPIQSPYRLSQALTDSLEFGLPNPNRSLREANSHDSNTNVSAQLNERTPVSSSKENSHKRLSWRSSLNKDEGRTSNVCSPQSPQSRRRAPLASLSSSDINSHQFTTFRHGEGSPVSKKQTRNETKTDDKKRLSLVFGKPHIAVELEKLEIKERPVEKSQAQKHLSPERMVKGAPTSMIRRSGVTIRSNNAFIQGFPQLPSIPLDYTPLKHNTRSSLVPIINTGDVERDLWGRKMAGGFRSCIILVTAIMFPPLLLFLAFGYFDTACGTIHRGVKIAAAALAAIVFATATALVITFAILGW